MTLILTGKEIKALAEFAGFVITRQTVTDEDILSTAICVDKKEGRKIASYAEYPEEGAIDLSNF